MEKINKTVNQLQEFIEKVLNEAEAPVRKVLNFLQRHKKMIFLLVATYVLFKYVFGDESEKVTE